MPDTGANYSLPPGYFVQSGDTILPSQHNPIFEDVAAAMNARMMRNGSSPMTGNLQMGSKQITGLAAASQPHHAPRLDQVTPRSAFLLSASALSLAANEMIYASGTSTAAKTTLSAFARTLLDDASAATARVTLGAVGNTGDEAIGGVKTFTGSQLKLPNSSGSAASPGLEFAAGTGIGSNTDPNVSLSLITGGNRRLTVNDASQRIVAGYPFSGSGEGLTNLPASSLTGTIADARLPSTAVRTSRTVNVGPGLSGGGDLGSNVTINLGIPSSITADSTNSRDDTSHTHAIGEDAIRVLIARGGTNQQGTFAWARNTSGTTVAFGNDISGANLSPAADDGSNFGSLNGTWTCLGRCPPGAATQFKRRL